jgi:hypothetical protein
MGHPSPRDGDRLHQDAHEGFAAQTEPATAEIKQARTAGLKHTQAAADANA